MAAQFRAGAITGDPAPDRDTGRARRRQADRSAVRCTMSAPLQDGRTLEIISDPMPDGGFVIALSDITALARAEAEAKQRAPIQAVMLDTIRHGITLFGPDRRLIAVNRLAAGAQRRAGARFRARHALRRRGPAPGGDRRPRARPRGGDGDRARALAPTGAGRTATSGARRMAG